MKKITISFIVISYRSFRLFRLDRVIMERRFIFFVRRFVMFVKFEF